MASLTTFIQNALNISIFWYSVNVAMLMAAAIVLGLLFLFWRIQRAEKLDFADMITKDGRAVSLTKVLQLIGGLTATWVIMKLTLGNQLTEGIFGLYLMYVGSIEGYSKYVSAKYGYTETSVKDAADAVEAAPEDDSKNKIKP
jgi:hypothetical protein